MLEKDKRNHQIEAHGIVEDGRGVGASCGDCMNAANFCTPVDSTHLARQLHVQAFETGTRMPKGCKAISTQTAKNRIHFTWQHTRSDNNILVDK